MNRSKLFSALIAASFLTTAAMAEGPKPVKTVAPKAPVAVSDTTKKKPAPLPKHKKVKPAKPDTTKKKPN
jgi:hypothetical protein